MHISARFFLIASEGTLLVKKLIVLDFFQELRRHVEQGLLGPTVKPVQSATVYQGREHPASDSERISDRGHAESNVESLPDSLIESHQNIIPTS